MAKLIFECFWNGEPAAGIRSGSEVVTIELKDTSQELIDETTVEYFRDVLREFYDGARVFTAAEMRKK